VRALSIRTGFLPQFFLGGFHPRGDKYMLEIVAERDGDSRAGSGLDGVLPGSTRCELEGDVISGPRSAKVV
jgi:hypothetical protein